MSLEQRLQEILNKNPPLDFGNRWKNICDWIWHGTPNHFVKDNSSIDDFTLDVYAKIHKEIDETSDSIALTSSSKYVREYKKWRLNNE